jgi:hypothetical protein
MAQNQTDHQMLGRFVNEAAEIPMVVCDLPEVVPLFRRVVATVECWTRPVLLNHQRTRLLVLCRNGMERLISGRIGLAIPAAVVVVRSQTCVEVLLGFDRKTGACSATTMSPVRHHIAD